MKIKSTQYQIDTESESGLIQLTFKDAEIEDNIIVGYNMINVLIENENQGQYCEFALTREQLKIIYEFGEKLFSHSESQDLTDKEKFNKLGTMY